MTTNKTCNICICNIHWYSVNVSFFNSEKSYAANQLRCVKICPEKDLEVLTWDLGSVRFDWLGMHCIFQQFQIIRYGFRFNDHITTYKQLIINNKYRSSTCNNVTNFKIYRERRKQKLKSREQQLVLKKTFWRNNKATQ